MPAKRSLSRVFADVVKAVVITAIACVGVPLIWALTVLIFYSFF